MNSVKKLLALMLCGILLLTGCGKTEETPAVTKPGDYQKVTCDDLTLYLPQVYQDLSGESFAEGLSMIYGMDTEAVSASYELVSDVAAVIPVGQPNAHIYATILSGMMGVEEEPIKEEYFSYFTYTTSSEGIEISYLCGVFLSQTKFWTVQCYCATEEFADRKAEFMEILELVVVD